MLIPKLNLQSNEIFRKSNLGFLLKFDFGLGSERVTVKEVDVNTKQTF